jgi:ribosomal protein S12 methylthiotransferase accessory factor
VFRMTLQAGTKIDVQGKTHRYQYSTDGSVPNPLESTYAALAGCAGVYAKKSCRELGIDDTGIAISLRVVAKAGQPLVPARFVTTVTFPARFDEEQRAAVLRSIEKCAVKAIIQAGPAIDFTVESAAPGAVETIEHVRA